MNKLAPHPDMFVWYDDENQRACQMPKKDMDLVMRGIHPTITSTFKSYAQQEAEEAEEARKLGAML